jgi:hypothetical protein
MSLLAVALALSPYARVLLPSLVAGVPCAILL